jgi:predicted lipoprotein
MKYMKKMNKYLNKLLAGSVLFVCSSQLAFGQNLITRDEDWTAINITVTDELVIPAYQHLQAQSSELIRAAEIFCAGLTASNLANLQNAYLETMAAWQAIQHIQFGPITYFNWNYRMQYWPDERGTSGRQLDALIAAADEAILSSNSFARQSVGVQGLPALERVLYANDALGKFQDNDYLCLLSMTIARNINEISSGVNQRWVDEYRALVLDPVADGLYEDAEDLSIDFLKALQESIAKIRDLKLLPVIGESFSASRNRSAESWRSENSLANIKNNIVSLEQLFLAYMAAFHEEDNVAVTEKFTEITQILNSLPDSLSAALENEEQYNQVQSLYAGVDALHEALETALKNTDLYLGFNSLDGD